MTSAESPGLAIDDTRSGVAFWIHVTPGARRPAIGGTHGDALRVAVASRPIRGEANEACEAAIAAAVGAPRGAVRVPRGSRGRRKRVEIDGARESLRARLLALAGA